MHMVFVRLSDINDHLSVFAGFQRMKK